MGCCQRCSEAGIQDASEQKQGFTQTRGKKGADRRKTPAMKGKDLAISKAKDLVTKGKDLVVKTAQELTQKALTKGVAATQKALSKDEASKVGQIVSSIDPTGIFDRSKH